MRKLLLLALSLFCLTVLAQERTVGLFEYRNGSYNGYTFYIPNFGTDIYVIDNCGRLVHSWPSDLTPGNSFYFLEDGTLLRTAKTSLASNPVFVQGGAGEIIQQLDWDNNLLWEFTYSTETYRLHHDIAPMPNGNILAVAWELKTEEEAIAAGRDPELIDDGVIWSEHIIEIDPSTDEIVWEWHIWDHLIQDFDESKDNFGVVADHPELLDINFTGGPTADGGANWLHFNSIDYHPVMDQILLSSPFLSEIYIIDHSTTSAEAAGHSGGNSGRGGDILYRWGNPQTYDHGTAADQQLFRQHNPGWIEKGLPDGEKIMVFNNGVGRNPELTSIDIIEPDMDDYYAGTYKYSPGIAYKPTTPEWSYSDPEFYSSFLGGTQRLFNGNTLICDGANGRFFEIDDNKEIVWEYENPVVDTGPLDQGDEIPIVNGREGNIVFRVTRYPAHYPGFDGRDLTPGEELETNPLPSNCEIVITGIEDEFDNTFEVYPIPANNTLSINLLNITNPAELIKVYNLSGTVVGQYSLQRSNLQINVNHWKSGIYIIRAGHLSKRIVITN